MSRTREVHDAGMCGTFCWYCDREDAYKPEPEPDDTDDEEGAWMDADPDRCPGPRGYQLWMTFDDSVEHFMRWHDTPDGFRIRMLRHRMSGPWSQETFDRDAHALLDEMRREVGS